jgi:hypothetical protein
LFLHLPKTAGSTLRRIIEWQYGADAVWTIGEPTSAAIDQLVQLPRRRLDAIRAVVGHFPFGLHNLLPWPVAYVTLVREPVDRIVSHYYYAERTSASKLSAEVKATGRSLRRYVEEAPSGRYFNNGQTRLLGSDDVRHAAPADRTTLARATERLLSSFAIVGLTDRFDKSLALISRYFGWRDTGPNRRENIGRNRTSLSDIPADDLQSIAAHNVLDTELYVVARQRFAANAQSHPPQPP